MSNENYQIIDESIKELLLRNTTILKRSVSYLQHVHLDQQIWSLSMRKANGNHVWKIDVSDFLKIKNWYFQP
jgi:hypothetical protein